MQFENKPKTFYIIEYNSLKDEYYIEEWNNNGSYNKLETFYGDYSFEEYLRDELKASESEIQQAYNLVNLENTNIIKEIK